MYTHLHQQKNLVGVEEDGGEVQGGEVQDGGEDQIVIVDRMDAIVDTLWVEEGGFGKVSVSHLQPTILSRKRRYPL